jgi:ATP-dependent DNA helicase RecG
MFTITLQRPPKASAIAEKILRLAEMNPQITIDELAANIERTTRSIEMQIQKLKETGKIERIGSVNGGCWKVN